MNPSHAKHHVMLAIAPRQGYNSQVYLSTEVSLVHNHVTYALQLPTYRIRWYKITI